MNRRRRRAPGMAWIAVAGALAVAGVAPLAVWSIAVLAWIVAADRH